MLLLPYKMSTSRMIMVLGTRMVIGCEWFGDEYY
jgi:hypothetical protein